MGNETRLARAEAAEAENARLREALADLHAAFYDRHGCFPLDRNTAQEKLWYRAMSKARAALDIRKDQPNV